MGLSLMSCGKGEKGPDKESASTDETLILVDENIRPLIETAYLSFRSQYPGRNVRFEYVPEARALDALLADQAGVILIPRKLTLEELEYLKNKYNQVARVYPFTHDALAVIAHPNQQDTALTTAQIEQILLGKTDSWPGGGKVTPVFDKTGSSSLSYLQRTVLKGRPAAKGLYAAGSSLAVIQYVASHPGALGFVGYSHFSDLEDPETRKLVEQVRLLRVNGHSLAGPDGAMAITQEGYPYTRTYYAYSTQNLKQSGTAFASYLMEPDGQLIVLKSGMVPAYPPQREVEIKTGDVDQMR